MTTASDYYEVLQVSPNADEEVIQAAYRRLAMKWHPDRNPGDPFAVSQMKLLNEAFGVLSNSTKRREYDWGRRTGTSGGTDKDVPKAKASAPPEPEPAASPKPRAGSPASNAGWSRAIPDAPAIFVAGGILFLIGHYDILSGKSPAGSLAFLLTCFIWGVLFGTPAYLCFQAKKRTAASVVATLFLLAAGLDVGVAVYNRYEMDKIPQELRPEFPTPFVGSPLVRSLTDPVASYQPVSDFGKMQVNPIPYLTFDAIERGMRNGWSWDRLASEIKEFGGNPAPYRQPYQLVLAQRKQVSRGETQLAYLVRRSIPVGSALGSTKHAERYRAAIERFNAGKATQDDIDVIARFEWQQEIDGSTVKEAGKAN